MRFGRFHLALAALACGALLTTAADAQPRNRTGATGSDRTVVRWQDDNGRTRTRIIVQKRSFLDAGTNVQPGERKYTDYVMPPNRSVTGIIDNTPASRDRETMPGPFYLPSRNNPRQW